MNFFKGFLSSCLGALVAMALVLGGIIMIISMSGGEEVMIKENSVLRLDLDVPIIEIEREDPFAGLSIFGAGSRKPIGLAQLRLRARRCQGPASS